MWWQLSCSGWWNRSFKAFILKYWCWVEWGIYSKHSTSELCSRYWYGMNCNIRNKKHRSAGHSNIIWLGVYSSWCSVMLIQIDWHIDAAHFLPSSMMCWIWMIVNKYSVKQDLPVFGQIGESDADGSLRQKKNPQYSLKKLSNDVVKFAL